MKRILFLSRWFPYPPNNGSKIRIFNLLRCLSENYEIELVSFSENAIDGTPGILDAICHRIHVVPYKSFNPYGLKALMGLFSRKPRSILDTHSDTLQAYVNNAVITRKPDLIIASQLDMAPYVMGAHDCPKILEEIELTLRIDQLIRQDHPVKKARYALSGWKLSGYLRDLVPGFECCTVASNQEKEHVKMIVSDYDNVYVVPNGVALADYDLMYDPPDPTMLIYTGALTYQPNYDAMSYFIRDIFPRILNERKDVQLYITGSLDGVSLDQLPSNQNVVYTGYLDDIRPLVARSWLSLAPLRSGGGTRLKILESLALRTPVVTTTKGMEGLSLMPGDDILVADSPGEFASSVLNLLGDTELRERLSRNGRRAVEKAYNWSTIGLQFNQIIEGVFERSRQSEANIP